MKQKDLAKKVGTTAQHLNAVVCGRKRASVNLAEKLESATGVSRSIWIWGTTHEKKAAFQSGNEASI